MDSQTVWCPSCGAEYRPGSVQCVDCRVTLVGSKPSGLAAASGDGELIDTGATDALVELGEWARLDAQILRRRLESAGIPVMIEWSSTSWDATGTMIVPEEQSEFAWAIVNEVPVEDEVPDSSPGAYVTQIEEHLSAAAGLLDELRTKLETLEAGDL